MGKIDEYQFDYLDDSCRRTKEILEVVAKIRRNHSRRTGRGSVRNRKGYSGAASGREL